MAALEVNIDTFDELVIEQSHERLVVLDISAEWCGPCRILEPVITSVAQEFNASEFVLTKIEAEDENMKIAGRYGVRGFPTVIAFINGEEVDRFHSAQTPNFVRDFIENNLDKR
ncbi:MAG: thioredoxin family protein [Candidatus Thioglobus sp.]|nr:thioredoxin family protein [Candidatus Thioglobus pontius]MBL6976515.1 thioredoxin family protein [Candidatus Thioglobus sp.]MBL6983998.1 thioredoxin family protein [Candidatus Thioglobus sp.]